MKNKEFRGKSVKQINIDCTYRGIKDIEKGILNKSIWLRWANGATWLGILQICESCHLTDSQNFFSLSLFLPVKTFFKSFAHFCVSLCLKAFVRGFLLSQIDRLKIEGSTVDFTLRSDNMFDKMVDTKLYIKPDSMYAIFWTFCTGN